jgi:hypothetical protein
MGTLINDIRTVKTDESGRQKLSVVPLTYAPKDKMLARVLQDPNIDRETAVATLPMISFELTGMNYDGERKLLTINRMTQRSDLESEKGVHRYQYTPVPYDYHFNVYVYAKNLDDAHQIVEQIVPYFTPTWTTSVAVIPEMDVNWDINVELNDVNMEDRYDGSFKERRAIIWTLSFTLKGYLYKPVKKSNIIKFVRTNFYIPTVEDLRDAVGVTPVAEYMTTQPGLTANGEPTSNVALTIPYADIDEDDDWAYIDIIYSTDEL